MFKANLRGLKLVIQRFDDPALKAELEKIPSMKGVAAIISQAIADNFEQEGPGWAPLKAATLRYSVKKAVISRMQKRARKALGIPEKGKMSVAQRVRVRKMVDRQLVSHERKARSRKDISKPDQGQAAPNRKILQKTGLLKKTATIMNFTGSNKSGTTGSNIYKVEGTNIVWGTNLSYAAIHNSGNPAKNIPKREFLVLRDAWKNRLNQFLVGKVMDALKKYITKGAR